MSTNTIRKVTDQEAVAFLGHCPELEDSPELVTVVLALPVQEVRLNDLLFGYWVDGISAGRHDGRPSRTFQVSNPMAPQGQMSMGRMTLIEGTEVLVVRPTAEATTPTWCQRYEALWVNDEDARRNGAFDPELAEAEAIKLCTEMCEALGEEDGMLAWHIMMGVRCNVSRTSMIHVAQLAKRVGMAITSDGKQVWRVS